MIAEISTSPDTPGVDVADADDEVNSITHPPHDPSTLSDDPACFTPRVAGVLARTRDRLPECASKLLEHRPTLIPQGDESGETYVVTGQDDQLLFAPVDSDEGVRLISEDQYRKGKPCDAAAISRIQADLKHAARLGKKVKLHRRFVMDGEDLLVDMLDGQQVRITSSGFRPEPYDDVRFQRHITALPIKSARKCRHLLRLVQKTLSIENEGEAILLITQMVAAHFPWANKPILMLVGDPGSGKTTTARQIVELIDPSSTPALTLDKKSLVQVAATRAVASFDNLAPFRQSMSDLLCRCVTGSQEERRRLYTDNDPVLFEMKLWIILNGTELPAHYSDFLDRLIILERNRRDEFVPSNVLDERFQARLPLLRGALYQLISNVLRTLPSISRSGGDRMADFALLGGAVAVALGKSQSDFSTALNANRRLARSAHFDSLPWLELVAKVAEPFQGSDNAYEYPPEELLAVLRQSASDSFRHLLEGLPQGPSWLSRKLRAAATSLRDRGIGLEIGRRSANQRYIKVFRLT